MVFVLVATSVYANTNFDKAKQFVAERDFESAEKEIILALKDKPNSQEILILAGDIYAELDKNVQSLSYYKRAYEEDKDNSLSARKYALALSEKGDFQDALKIIRKAIKNAKDDPYNNLVLGEILTNADSLKDADLAIRGAIRKNEKLPEGYLALGNLYFRQKVYELAQTNFEEALKLAPNNIPAQEKLATAYYRMGYFNSVNGERETANIYFTKSLAEWDKITKADTKNARAYYEKGRILFFASKFADAASSLSQYTTLRPEADNIPIVRWYLAQSYVKVGNCDAAEPHLVYASEKIDSVKDKAMLELARCYYNVKKFKQSAEAFTTIISRGEIKFESDDNERLGRAMFFSGGDTTKSMSYLLTAVQQNPRKCRLMDFLGDQYYRRKMFVESIEMQRMRIASCGDSISARAYTLIGSAYYSLNNVDSALISLNMALAKDSNQVFARSLLISCYLTQKKLPEVRTELANVSRIILGDPIKYKNDIPTIENSYSQVWKQYYDAKDYPEALKVAKSMADVNPTTGTAGWLRVAFSHQALQDKDGACKAYSEVLKRDPKNESALKNKKDLLCN